MKQSDLAPFIGSRGRVSEILSGKRQLTLPMIRSLHEGLGIPLSVLVLPQRNESSGTDTDVFLADIPFLEMKKRGWFSSFDILSFDASENKGTTETLENFFNAAWGPSQISALLRTTHHIRGKSGPSKGAIDSWVSRVAIKSLEQKPKGEYRRGTITSDFYKNLISLSWSDNGPSKVGEFLSEHGISLVIEPHLPKTYLDGAAFFNRNGNPVVGMTVRYDRLDNFWFVLCHELAHINLHLDTTDVFFVDNMDVNDDMEDAEFEADLTARNALVPNKGWSSSRARREKTKDAVIEFANETRIHPALVAGRIRQETGNFRILNDLVGNGLVRRNFSDIVWRT